MSSAITSFFEEKSSAISAEALGPWMYQLLERLYPICRSLAGPGNRETLDILAETIPLVRTEVPSGTSIFDWTTPDEWIPREAYLLDPNGIKRASFSEHNLNLVNYSVPIHAEMELEELLPHIYSLPDQPDVVPYVTSYYKRSWGFCMTDRERRSLPAGRYEVHIDTTLEPGFMSIGEVLLPGESEQEVLISTYICHPSMANDNLSSVVVASGLYRLLEKLPRRNLSYRFLFVPETIGSIAWLHINQEDVKRRTMAGIVLSCVGGDAPFTYKRSRRDNALIDRMAAHFIGERGGSISFSPVTGSDERQYCSPGFDLPVGMFSRAYPGTFPSYHTSADTPDKTPSDVLADSLGCIFDICLGLEANVVKYKRQDPFCEPMLSKRNLYHSVSIRKEKDFDRSKDPRSALMWVLNLSCGDSSLIDIAERSGLDLLVLAEAAERAANAGVLERLYDMGAG